MSGYEWADGVVQIDNGEVIRPKACQYVTNDRWNGWVIPRFTPAVAWEAAQELAAIEYGAGSVHRQPDGAIAVISDPTITDPGAEVYEIEEDGYVYLGAMNWTWELVA